MHKKIKTLLLILLSGIVFSGITFLDVCVVKAATKNPSINHIKSSSEKDKTEISNRKNTRHNVLRFAVHVSSIENMDPHFAAGSQERALADLVFNGLLRYKPGNAPKIEPDLASEMPEFKIINGEQVWTIKLRKGVMFHPFPETKASELTADDVLFSLQKSADKDHCAYSGKYMGMTMEKVDRYTVKIILKNPVSPVLFFPKLTNYAGGFIVSKRAVIKMGYEKFKHHPVGTGPFVFKSYKPGKKLILTAHGQYFRGCPRLKGVEILFLPDIKDREAGLKSGNLDVIMGTGKKGWIEQIEQEPDIKLDFHGVGEMITIYFNTSIKPMDDVRVRKAIAHALSRETFLNTTNRRLVKKAYSPVPVQFLPGGLTKKEVESLDLAYPKNLQKARQLLMDAGYPDGFTLELVSSEKRLYLSCYNSMRDQLAKIGIKCHINIKAHSEMHRLIRLHPQPLVIYVAWRPNADLFLSRFFHSSAIIVTGAKPDTNFSHYKKIDKIIKDARLSINPEKQINLWKHAQIRILTDMAAYPIMFIKQCYAKRADVDYGHELISTMALYPQFTEKTRIIFNDSSYLNNITTVEKSNSTTKSRNKDD